MTISLRHLKLVVTYDGSPYFGFQLQPDVPTIQQVMEKSLEKVLQERVRVHGAGRTDAGVHALGQVTLIRTRCPIPIDKLILAVNRVLPDAIRVRQIEEVDEDFHPRFSAKAKHYRYLIREIDEPSPFLARYYCQLKPGLDLLKMREGTALYLGEHNFAAFTKSPAMVENPIRNILQATIEKQGELIIFDVIGPGFLYNMVRNMARAIILIGRKEMYPQEICELYLNQNRQRLGTPAPAAGLYLMKVMY